ncbi:MAG: hypothetical protein AAB467_04685 [Patescibacteria group bacterium]
MFEFLVLLALLSISIALWKIHGVMEEYNCLSGTAHGNDAYRCRQQMDVLVGILDRLPKPNPDKTEKK